MITTYTALLSSIADFLNRQDLTAVIPTFVQLAEAKFNRELRTRDMQTLTEATTDGEFITVPGDFLQEYSLELLPTSAPQLELTYIGELEAKDYRAKGLTGNVRFYSIFGNAFELLPAPTADVDFRLKYFAAIPALSVNSTNWLLTKSPDLYLHSALIEATPYLKNDDRLPMWAAMRQQEIDAINLESERAQRSTTRLVARIRSFG